MNTDTTTKCYLGKTGFASRIRTLALALSIALLAGCGGGGGGTTPTGINTTPDPVASNSYTVTSDGYGLEKATYLSSSVSTLGIVFRAAIASSLNDPAYETVSRIDIVPGATITAQTTYALGSAGGAPSFPGNLYFLNGHPSTLLRTVGGTISFSRYGGNSGDRVSGSYNAVVEDDNDPAKPTYTIAASFDFVIGSYGAVLPAPGSLALAAQPAYQSYCASCHALGGYDTSASGAPDLALKGGEVPARYAAGQAGHQGVTLTADQIAALKVLLNTN
ncbi:hypothetical protein KOM00_00920 [Geomonas sp. Red69]|uniref:Cytochrome c domain-containing protein n=1 Tax=Geomonas diazotrophica TaxID=2843197 RepID=A0ABX8JGZ8_9BACT|nr:MULTISPECIES: hypothetical protein [Geomonas]MBU5635291.1 hypothetical protein [Geomonas diazotrophica]QWV97655.1 hypothetical protein KP005_20370 [Geomonas nitrogeniifigens]QXE86792.1 hypothetical protein KP003_21000 [Geomonas nitrogeniifigens]